MGRPSSLVYSVWVGGSVGGWVGRTSSGWLMGLSRSLWRWVGGTTFIPSLLSMGSVIPPQRQVVRRQMQRVVVVYMSLWGPGMFWERAKAMAPLRVGGWVGG